MAESIVNLGAGSNEQFMDFVLRNRPSYREGDPSAYTMVDGEFQEAPEYSRRTDDRQRMGETYAGRGMERDYFYEGFAEPSLGITEKDIQDGVVRLSDLQDEANLGDPYAGETGVFVPQQVEVVDGKVITNPIGFDNGGDVPEGIMSVDLGKEADKTGPDTMRPIPQYPGIEGFDIYTDLAPEQFPRRPIAKQNFGKKRGFQFGQMVQRDEAVSGKLLKQAGIMTPVEVVKQNVDPKVMEQISRIMGRDIV